MKRRKRKKHGGRDFGRRDTGGASNVLGGLAAEEKHSRLLWIEYILPPVLALVVGIWAFQYLGTSVEWDDLFYMNVSQHTTREAWVLNRYGHIYLQKLFFWLVGDALQGAKAYFSFLYFSTSVFIYWCARILAGRRGCVIGIGAVLLFWAQDLFAYYAGCTFSDMTVMFLVTLGTFLYLAFFLRPGGRQKVVLVIMGLLFFWAVKSKESGVCLAIFAFGLGIDEEGKRSIRRFGRDISWVCVGMAAGFVILMLLDGIFLHDPIFSIRPSSIRRCWTFNYRGYLPPQKRAMSWYTYTAARTMFPPVLIYFLVGARTPGRRFSRYEKLAWVFPLVTVMFVTYVRGAFHVIWRYFAPAIPGICIWAAQFFRFKTTGRVRFGKSTAGVPRLALAGALILSSFLIVTVFMSRADKLIETLSLESVELLYKSAIMPFWTTVLVGVAGLSRRRGLAALFVSALSFLFIVCYPLQQNVESLKKRVVAQKSEYRYEPYRVYADQLRFDEDVKILVSKDVHKRYWMLGREVRAHCWMFNVFFNQKFTYEQFIDGEPEDILKGDYTYAYLTAQDWEGLRVKHEMQDLLANYDVRTDRTIPIILLKRR